MSWTRNIGYCIPGSFCRWGTCDASDWQEIECPCQSLELWSKEVWFRRYVSWWKKVLPLRFVILIYDWWQPSPDPWRTRYPGISHGFMWHFSLCNCQYPVLVFIFCNGACQAYRPQSPLLLLGNLGRNVDDQLEIWASTLYDFIGIVIKSIIFLWFVLFT